MKSIDSLNQKPAPDQLDEPKFLLSGLARDVSKHAKSAQLEILGAESAEELAIALAKFHGALAEASAIWDRLAHQLRHWAH